MKDFDLTKLFGSKCRTKILEKFFLEHESGNYGGFHMRGLSRDLDEQINSIKRELDSLNTLGLLKTKVDAKKKYFFLNRNFFLVDEFKQIFLKTFNPLNTIKQYFKQEKALAVILINDSLTNRLIENSNNIVDIFLIGEINKIEFNEFLEKTFFSRKIKYAIISEGDFYNRIDYGDKLIQNIFYQNGNIFLKDNINALEKLK